MLLRDGFLQVLPYYLAALIPALTFHEWGHAFVASRFGDNTPRYMGRLTLNPLAHLDPLGTAAILITGFIGWAKPVPINPSAFRNSWGEFWVAAAGPMANICLASIAAVFAHIGAYAWFGDSNIHILVNFLQIFVFMNLGLAFFNLIPIGPLDGSHLLARLLPLRLSMQFREFNTRHGSMLLFGIILVEGLLRIPLISPVIRFAVLFTASRILGMG